jgi:hypothetical protein
MNINRVLGYLAAASAAVAILLWALPMGCYGGVCGFDPSNWLWFSISSPLSGELSGEAPWVFAFALASVFLLIARAGNRR